ncbi:uncharacterized protein LOC110458707 isoform X5 [Mizuhopecten yessoensis]|uniref:uncharacterized protein LOC110458707 isoform X5 n=1 Tax=Mizuhopecten yessoensis TaxID=6573 RepID=UPI000B4579CE|nr:uncharacterized protein LOC110458707 isoform X5 [Mizuhopecten yessoensis]
MSRNTVNDVFTVNENVQTGKYCSRHHSKSHIELPCGDTYCMYCLKDEVQRYTWMMLTCKHCQKEISKEQIAIFLQKEVFQENPFKLTLNHHPSKNCSVHKHDLIQFELPCGQTVCIRCLYQRKKYAFKTYGEGPDVRVCGCGEYLQLRHIEYCISQCEQKALFQENPFKLVSNRHSLKYCSIHKHDLIQFELPCDQTGCIRCLYEFKTYTFKPSNEASDASVCSCGGYLRLRHIEECISQCEQKAVFQENPFKLASNHDPQKYCFVHKHDLIQFELPCDQTGCIRCLYEFKTYTFKPSNEASDASVCSCGGYLRLRHIEECISQCEQKAADLRVFSPTKDNNGFSIHPDSETAAVLRHTWTYINDDGSCPKHNHSKVCLKLSCGKTFCHQCIQTSVRILESPLRREKQDHIICNCSVGRILKSEITSWIENLPKSITEARILQRFNQNKECPEHHMAICARLPCDVLLCRQCIVKLKEEAKIRHTREPINRKQPYAADCTGCSDKIPGEVLESFLKEGLQDFQRHNRKCWCRKHKHHKIVVTTLKNDLLCKLCLELAVESNFSLDGESWSIEDSAKLFEDAPHDELFSTVKEKRPCDCGTWQAQAKLPCGLLVCHHCVYKLDQKHRKTGGCLCPKCSEVIAAQSLQMFLEKYDDSECYVNTTSRKGNCHEHRHWKVFCESKLLADESCTKPLCLMCIWKNKKLSELPSNVPHFLRKVDLQMKDLHEAPKCNSTKQICQRHKHHKVVCKAPCGEKYCIRCFEELLLSKVTEQVRVAHFNTECVECRTCTDVIPLEVLKTTIATFIEGDNVEIKITEKCKCSDPKEAASLPCGATLCKNCFEKPQCTETLNVLGNKCVLCPDRNCNDVIPIQTLESHFSKREQELIPKYRSWNPSKWCRTHQHHKICITDDKDASLCKLCLVSILKISAVKYIILDGEKTPADAINTLIKDISEIVKSKTMFMKFICGHFICVECQSPYDNCSGNKHEVNDAEFLEAYHDFGGTGANDSEGAACSRMDVVTCYMCTKKGSLVSKLNKIYYERPVPGSPRPSDLGALPNIGFTCYANSIFQILNQTPELADCLKQVNRTMPKKSLSALLLKILEGITHNRVHAQIERIGELMRRVMEIDDSFRLYHQNDCHSFLMCLLNALKDTQTDKRGCVAAPSSLFEGRMCNAFRYKPCNHSDGGTIEDSQIFFSLVIPVPQQVKERWTIEKGLAKMMEEELFDKNVLSCRQCETTGKGSKDTCTSKTLDIVKAPKRLMLHIGRFKQDEDYFQGRIYRKNNDPVVFKEILLLPVVENGKERKKSYELYGIVLHMGGLEGGHYYSMVKKKGTTQWYTCSDSSIYSTKLEDIFHDYSEVYSKAYLLFYKEI